MSRGRSPRTRPWKVCTRARARSSRPAQTQRKAASAQTAVAPSASANASHSAAPAAQAARVAGQGRRVGVHRLEHHPGISEGRLFRGGRGHARQPGRGVGPAAQQVEHQPPRRREEQRPGRLLAQPFQSAHLPVDRLDVEHLAGDLQPPQVSLQPRVGIQDVGRHLVESAQPATGARRARPAPSARRVRRRGSRRPVPAAPAALRTVHRLVRELDGARRMAGVRPAAGQRSRQPGPGPVVGRAGQHVIQLGRQLARLGPEHVDRGRTEHRLGPPVEVVLGAAAGHRLVVQARRRFSPAGRASSVGTVEEITDSGRGVTTLSS